MNALCVMKPYLSHAQSYKTNVWTDYSTPGKSHQLRFL